MDALPTVLDWYSVVTSAAVVFVALAGVRYVVHCMHVQANETYVAAVSALTEAKKDTFSFSSIYNIHSIVQFWTALIYVSKQTIFESELGPTIR